MHCTQDELYICSPGQLLTSLKMTRMSWNNSVLFSRQQGTDDVPAACVSDPSRWAAQFPSCGGLRQSPINIVTSKVHVNSALPPFSFTGHTNRINITVENKGHSGNEEPFLCCLPLQMLSTTGLFNKRESLFSPCSSLCVATAGATDGRSSAWSLPSRSVSLPLGRQWETRVRAHHWWRKVPNGGIHYTEANVLLL